MIIISNRLQFSPKFSHHMAILSVLISVAISVMTPATYGIMAWLDFHKRVVYQTEEVARQAGRTALENPDFWFYNVTKFIDPSDEADHNHDAKSIRTYDKNLNLKFMQTLNDKVFLTYSYRTPVRYGSEVYGYIEIERNVQPMIITVYVLLAFFSLLGMSIGFFLYRLPVKMVRMAEKGVQIHVEQAKKQAELEVARLDRLSLIGKVAAGIAHEIRNPLTTIKGYLQFLSKKPVLSPFGTQFDLMLDELNRANSIISEFLSLSHEKAIQMKPCNLSQIILAFIPLIESDALLNGMSVTTDLKNVPDLTLDEKEIRQLILNLTRNAFEAMQYGGCITIKTDILDHEIVLSIADQGKGIDPALVDKLGTPFFTTKDTGTGLGLAVCYSIVHRHKARMEFATNKNGTTFSIYFPMM